MSDNTYPKLLVEYFIKKEGEWHSVWCSVFAQGFKAFAVNIKIRGGLSLGSAQAMLRVRQKSQVETR